MNTHPLQAAAVAAPAQGGTPRAVALWLLAWLLKLLQVPEPPDTLKQAAAALLVRFVGLLLFGALTPLLCAWMLQALDSGRLGGLTAAYREEVVAGFSINETIYRADKERLDYLLQMRHVNFFDSDGEDGSPAPVFMSVIPGQQGRIVVERARVVPHPTRGDAGTRAADAPEPPLACPPLPNPELKRVLVTVGDAQQDATQAQFKVETRVPLELDSRFWKALKIEKDAAAGVKSLRLTAAPDNHKLTSECFDLLVDLRIEVFKTKGL